MCIRDSQIVVMPGINNGDELVRTVEDLYKLRPSIENVAAVPIGITKFREGLADLEIYNKETAKEELDRIKVLQEKYMKEIGSPFVRLSDEFYVMAEEEVPNEEFYNGYEQIEDGVGMIRLLRETMAVDIKNKLTKNGKGKFLSLIHIYYGRTNLLCWGE